MTDVVGTHTLGSQTSSGNMQSNGTNPSSWVSHKTSKTGSSRLAATHHGKSSVPPPRVDEFRCNKFQDLIYTDAGMH